MNQTIQMSETREQKMLREEQNLKQLMIEQYYKYLTLLRTTNNFEKNIQTYQNIKFSEYAGQIAVVGRITQINMATQKEQQYCFPLVQTSINKNLFGHQEVPSARRQFAPILRKFIISSNIYKKKLIIPLNKVISTGKKNKEQLFIFTHLQLLLKDQKELCFSFTDNSFIMQLDQHFYNSVFKNLELSLASTYSDLSLSQIFLQGELSKGSTFVIQDIRNKIHENLNNFTVLGVLKSISWVSMQKAVNAKEKEVGLQIIQDVFHRNYQAVGMCRIYVRFDILDEEELVKHLKEGCVYLFLVGEILLSDNIFLNLKLNYWRKNFIRITDSPVKLKNIDQIYQGMQLSTMSYFTNPSIFRNHYKFRTFKYQLKLLYAKLTCEKCESAIFRCSSFQYECRNQCGKVGAQLRLWSIIGVMDESGYGQLSMEDKSVVDYFDISQEEAIQFKEQVAKEEQEEGKAGITLYFKKTKEEFNDDEPNQCIAHERNPFLASLIERFLVKIIHKTVIGTGKINNNQNFHSFDQETKHEALTSFARSKEFFKKAKVFVNGNLRTFQGRGRLIPYIKVEKVLD